MVTMENYEEYMLLEADGELTEAEQKELYAFVEQHPELKNELALFMATKLEPDSALVFEGKEQLLKTEEITKPRTIGLGKWRMYSALAAACVAALLLLLRKPQQDTGTDNIAQTKIHANTDDKTAAMQQPPAGKELHSIPTSPVAIKTEEKKHLVAAKKEKGSTIQKEETPTEPIAQTHQQPEPITPIQQTPGAATEGTETLARNMPNTPVTEEPVEPIKEIRKDIEEKENRKLLALAPIENKLGGIPEIKDAVVSKIEKVKNITTKIKDADIRFRFGNSEFTVKL